MVKFRDPLADEPLPRREDDDPLREKPAWRELDRERDRGRHVIPDEKPKPRPKAFAEKRAESKAKMALEQFFQGKKSKEMEGGWKHVIEVSGRSFSVRATNYVEKYGIPREWDDLLRLLDHEKPDFVVTILDRMMELLPKETAVRRDLLIGRLRVLKMEREEPPLIQKIEALLETLQSGS